MQAFKFTCAECKYEMLLVGRPEGIKCPQCNCQIFIVQENDISTDSVVRELLNRVAYLEDSVDALKHASCKPCAPALDPTTVPFVPDRGNNTSN